MVDCNVKNWQGELVGQVTLNLRVAKEESSAHLLHRAVVRHLANARQGNACSKTRAEVRGGGRKPWRQKGTGRARAGSIRSPLWRGGGVIFGPKPRDFSLKMNRKERRLALRTAISSRIEDLIIVKDFIEQFPDPKTKHFTAALTRWGVESRKKVALILLETDNNIYLSVRNLSYVKILRADSLNIYDLLNADKIVMTSEALVKIQEVYND